jgi:hypothetical protein
MVNISLLIVRRRLRGNGKIWQIDQQNQHDERDGFYDHNISGMLADHEEIHTAILPKRPKKMVAAVDLILKAANSSRIRVQKPQLARSVDDELLPFGFSFGTFSIQWHTEAF